VSERSKWGKEKMILNGKWQAVRRILNRKLTAVASKAKLPRLVACAIFCAMHRTRHLDKAGYNGTAT